MSNNKLLNYNELSVILTGKPNVIRANRNIPKRFRPSMDELIAFIENWAKENGRSNRFRFSVKVPDLINKPKIVQYMPFNFTETEKGIWSNGEKAIIKRHNGEKFVFYLYESVELAKQAMNL